MLPFALAAKLFQICGCILVDKVHPCRPDVPFYHIKNPDLKFLNIISRYTHMHVRLTCLSCARGKTLGKLSHHKHSKEEKEAFQGISLKHSKTVVCYGLVDFVENAMFKAIFHFYEKLQKIEFSTVRLSLPLLFLMLAAVLKLKYS